MKSIKFFKIFGLFGNQDIEIPFEDQIKIIIGENGLGKTTVLNCIYYVLKQKWEKLLQIDFYSIEIEFTSNNILFF